MLASKPESTMNVNRRGLLIIADYFKNKSSWLARRRKIIITLAATIHRRRKLLIKLQQLIIKLYYEDLNTTKRIRCCRRFPINNGWWETVLNEYTDKRFKETFRVSRRTFQYILTNIQSDITKQTTSEIWFLCYRWLPSTYQVSAWRWGSNETIP